MTTRSLGKRFGRARRPGRARGARALTPTEQPVGPEAGPGPVTLAKPLDSPGSTCSRGNGTVMPLCSQVATMLHYQVESVTNLFTSMKVCSQGLSASPAGPWGAFLLIN